MGIANERMKALRSQSDITLRDMAERIGVSEATVQRYESGKISKVPYKAIVEYAKCFHVTPKYLMGWENEPSVDLIELASKYDDTKYTIEIDKNDPEESINRITKTTEMYMDILRCINQLNDSGKEDLLRYAKYLTSDEALRKEDTL